jgi:serine/threonine-protein kinase HipA
VKRLRVCYSGVSEDPQPVGELAEDRGRYYFEFAPGFLTDGFPLSPFKFPVAPGVQTFARLPGVFDDALPDGWGRLLMDRFLRQRGKSPAAFTALDRLAWMGETAMGALTFHPPAQPSGQTQGFELGRLAREAQTVLADESGVVLPELLRAGGSPGGARPKALIGVKGDAVVTGCEPYPQGFEPWLVKFFAKTDAPDTGAVEAAYADMAQAAGIAFPERRLFETHAGQFFGVKRFDRADGQRIHMHSLANLIGADFRVPCLDYTDVHKVVRLLTASHAETVKAFRLMVFNALAHNRDDHAKNFAFLYTPEVGWRLAPGFDLTFAEGPGGEYTTAFCGEGRAPGVEHFRRIADGAGLTRKEADAVTEEVREAVSRWPAFASGRGVRKAASARIAKRLGGGFISKTC